MKRFFQTLGKKQKKAPKPPQQPITPGKSSNVAAGSSGSQPDQEDGISGTRNCCSVVDLPNLTAKTDNGSTVASSQIAIQDEASEFQVTHLGIDGTGSEHEFASKYLSSVRLRPVLIQTFSSLQNRRDMGSWS